MRSQVYNLILLGFIRKGEHMKIDRSIGILSILLQKEMVTAPELAEHFEVSGRTIGRDIEGLCKVYFGSGTL